MNIDAILTNADWPKRTPDKFADLVQKYDPNQPRGPKGSPEGGRFTKAQMAFLEQHGVQRRGTPAAEMQREPLPKTLAEAEDRIRNEPNEHAFLIRDGKPVKVTGDDDSHHIRMGGMTEADLKDVVFTHNHPSGFGLSNKDGISAARFNMLEMRAVTNLGTHIIRRTGTEWPPNFAEELKELDGMLRGMLGMQIHDQEITADEANALHHFLIYERLQKKLGGFVFTHESKGHG
jgi:hypothetical protein